jgi:hypothetical protein
VRGACAPRAWRLVEAFSHFTLHASGLRLALFDFEEAAPGEFAGVKAAPPPVRVLAPPEALRDLFVNPPEAPRSIVAERQQGTIKDASLPYGAPLRGVSD